MSMQPTARQSGTRPGFLARPKHGTARLDSCPGRPGPINQAVPGLPAVPAGRHGPPRQKTTGTDRPSNRERGHKPGLPLPLGHFAVRSLSASSSPQSIRSLSRSALRAAPPPAAHRGTASPSARRRSLCRIFITGPLPCGAPLQTPALPRWFGPSPIRNP
jgi:hypothetical protein